MKDEIKEILYFKEDADYKRLSVDEMLILKNYVINLQESEAYYYGQYKDHKSRNEKAIEYIENCMTSDPHLSSILLDNEIKKLLNILKEGV